MAICLNFMYFLKHVKHTLEQRETDLFYPLPTSICLSCFSDSVSCKSFLTSFCIEIPSKYPLTHSVNLKTVTEILYEMCNELSLSKRHLFPLFLQFLAEEKDDLMSKIFHLTSNRNLGLKSIPEKKNKITQLLHVFACVNSCTYGRPYHFIATFRSHIKIYIQGTDCQLRHNNCM